MTYEPLHHKYRPQTFAALVGQQAIATTLTNALRSARVAPAYLFTGARGTGKTSSARIFAKSLNCLKSNVPTENPCGMCEVCRSIARGSALDVIEIDAASNTGVDNIRELIERSQFAPVQCRYKVYVIDECHMLSTQAFNALLKTLEEPPDRVVFVLATTDPQRVLPTIISRCQRFDFRRIPLEEMVAHLGMIATQEKISISGDAVQLIAQISQGGLRDAESLLDQLSLLDGQVTIDRVWDLVGAVPERDLLALVTAIAQDDAIGVLDLTRRLMDRGREPLIVLQNLASFYRDLLIAKTAGDRPDLVSITPPTWAELCQFAQDCDLGWILLAQRQLRASELQVKNTTQPRLWLEVTLMGLLPSNHPANAQPPSPPPRSIASDQVPIAPSVSPPVMPVPPAVVPEAPAAIELPPQASVDEAADDEVTDRGATQTPEQTNLQQIWQQVLAIVQPPGTQMMMRQQCHLIAYAGEQARIGITSQPLFNMAKARMPNIEAAFAQFCGKPIPVTLEVVAPGGQQANEPPPPPSPMPLSRSTAPPIPAANRPEAPTSPPLSPPDPPLPEAPAWQEDDDITKAAKSLAQNFNGQVVDLEDDGVDLPPSEEFIFKQDLPPEAEAEPDEEEDDDDDEIPF